MWGELARAPSSVQTGVKWPMLFCFAEWDQSVWTELVVVVAAGSPALPQLFKVLCSLIDFSPHTKPSASNIDKV